MTVQGVERAAFGLRDVKLAGSDADMSFSGYGAVFGNVDSYGDVIVAGAFADTLAASRKAGTWPAMLMQHGGWGVGADDMTPVGIWTEMEEDAIGLKVTGKLADTVRGREAYALLKMTPRPAIDGLSIGYMVKAYEARTRPDEPRRKLTKVDLFEVSLVTFPANPKARIASVKSAGGLTIRDAEEALREAGFSRSEAKAIVAKGFKSIDQREAGDDTLAAARRLVSRISR
ncbi:COG3740 Phage head maturation protease [uncultured Caudovirales phage]|uniref:COG3740 Phage head maturation protease n=1 Tax=uncultured Caudovirales phage TaxID=2100421 RepID=A0A6J5MBZ0_9CAUD|nr:COG3740 Phage head maturation protease [uncultured Caudovirales phage]